MFVAASAKVSVPPVVEVPPVVRVPDVAPAPSKPAPRASVADLVDPVPDGPDVPDLSGFERLVDSSYVPPAATQAGDTAEIPRINEEYAPRARSYAMEPTEKELRRRDRQQKKLAKKFSKMQEKEEARKAKELLRAEKERLRAETAAEKERLRAAEAEAVEQGKTAVAALSHDIKTPIASIRAYSEALELGLARDEEEREGYARTIARKCDEVTSLTDDLFLHALADLDRIQVRCEEAPIACVVARAVADFDAGGTVTLGRLDEAQASCDPRRLEQAIGNLLANAAKYAPGADVEVEGVLDTAARAYRVRVRDRGPGIPPEDLPHIFKRFYRSRFSSDAQGVGLGLPLPKPL